ncbi:MAG TPA: type VI secretion system baseplate subunit TssF [Deltaproteobacteria bacterium]|nr:type VI secretion system baseplate subunit TssF [Deltaproteobacteria bacterium]
MFNRYYQQELINLKEQAEEFSQAHPALAPMLSGKTSDPDVERLMEGVAFLAGMLRQKLDDEFPEIVHGLIQLIFPHYLRPIPASTIISFTPKPNLRETITIPTGVEIASLPVEGTPCIFRTCGSCDVHPLEISNADRLESPGRSPAVRLSLRLRGMALSRWNIKRLRFYLSGDYSEATNVYFLLNRCVTRIVVKPLEGGSPLHLQPNAIVPAGFAPDDALFPYPGQSFPGYRLLQEYFILPEKFLFVDLTGLDGWKDRGDGSEFEIIFEMGRMPITMPRIRTENFVLFVVPAINVFEHESDPVVIDHHQTEYRVRPSARRDGHYQIYAIDRVVGLVQGTVEHREYLPFAFFGQHDDNKPVYNVTWKKSLIDQSPVVYVSVTYPPSAELVASETLSIMLTCTNASLPENLQLGDISQPTQNSPELTTFRNILPPTAPIQPPIGSNVLWHFLSHLSVNYLSLGRADNIKEMLRLYIFPEGRDRTKIAANMKRVNGILDIRISPIDRLVSGCMMRGQEIRIKLRQDSFASVGDMFLFGSVMDYFIGVYSSMNSFTQLIVEESITGEQYSWLPRIGDRYLI